MVYPLLALRSHQYIESLCETLAEPIIDQSSSIPILSAKRTANLNGPWMTQKWPLVRFDLFPRPA